MARNNIFTTRIQLYDYPHNRDSSTSNDAYFKNCCPSRLITGSDENPMYNIVKRPGIASSATYTAANAVGRGMYIWQGNVYYVLGSDIYKNGTSLSVTLNTSTGRVYFEVMGGGSASEKLLVLEGQDVWSVESNDTVTQHTTGANGEPTDLIGTMVGGIANLDGYIFVCDEDGKILHNNTQNDTAAAMNWSNSNIISANVFSDQLKGIVRHLNYIMAFGEWSTEFFYNAGNATGSVLSRAEGTVIRYGTPNFATVWQDENIVCFVARSRDGGNSVIVMEGLSPKIVSTKPIEKILNAATDMDEAYAFGLRIGGIIYYILTLPTTGKTLVFNLVDNTWCEWTSYDGVTETEFLWADIKGYVDSTGNTNFRALHISNGDVYAFDVDNYQDIGQDIKVKIVTDKIDLGTNQRKFLTRLNIIGDLLITSGNIGLRWTDDDYKTWNNASPITKDMQYIPAYNALGSFSRRAFELTFDSNHPMRLQYLELAVKLGTHAQPRL